MFIDNGIVKVQEGLSCLICVNGVCFKSTSLVVGYAQGILFFILFLVTDTDSTCSIITNLIC